MFGQQVGNVMERKKILSLPPETSVRTAAELMAKRKVSAVLVVQDGRLLGIFTERDAVYRVIAKGRETRATRLADVMTRDPYTVTPKASFGYAMLMMHKHGFRHVPVIENDRLVGIISARNALDPDLEEFRVEAQRREHILRQA
jgi:CBS domain-containing protein